MSAYWVIETACQVFIGLMPSMLKIPLERGKLWTSNGASIWQEQMVTEINHR
jgi:hypothetical protein